MSANIIYLDYNCFQRGFDDPTQTRIRLEALVCGLSSKDAIHLSCAYSAKANFFLTCDDKLVRQAQSLKLEFSIMNPVDYFRQEAM